MPTRPDDNLWFTESTETGTNRIGRITTTGTVKEFTVPTGKSETEGITAGADGSLWFTESDTNKLGRISTAGVITEFAVPAPNKDVHGIAGGPDNNLWFTEGDPIGKIARFALR